MDSMKSFCAAISKLRRDLEALAAIRSDVVPGVFVNLGPGQAARSAAELRLEDDGRSGRLLWRAAGQAGRFGLEASAGRP